MSLRQAKRFDDLVRLGRDNADAGEFWIIADEVEVTLAAQKSGEEPTGKVSIPRRYFDRLVDFYQRPQKLRRRDAAK